MELILNGLLIFFTRFTFITYTLLVLFFVGLIVKLVRG